MRSAMMAHVAVRQGHGLWVTVNGDSMRPLLVSGDRIFIEPVDSPRIGDLITFYEMSTLCTHRVIGRVKKAGALLLRTKGDCCGQWDLPIPLKSILGKVAVIQKGDRRLVIQGPFWRLLNLFLLVLSLGIGGILTLKWKFSNIITSQ